MLTSNPSHDPLEALAHCLTNPAVAASLGQMHLTGSGAVTELEHRLAALYGVQHALCVSSATAGLLALALALNLRNEEFITTPYTYGASLAGMLLLRNRPVFADITPETLTLNPDDVIRVITPKTRALLAVDIYGTPADSTALRQVADDYGLWYIADAAQSLGATRNGRPASSEADALVLSFTTGKPLFAGEGGAVLTNNRDLYEKLLWHCQHPARQLRELGSGLMNEFAINARIHPLAAFWANAMLDAALRAVAVHQTHCFALIDALNASGLIEPVTFAAQGIRPAFFRLTVAWQGRPQPAALTAALLDAGLAAEQGPASVQLLYRQPAFRAQYPSYARGCRCPQAERQATRRFSVMPIPPQRTSLNTPM